jgi:hypothetical protein
MARTPNTAALRAELAAADPTAFAAAWAILCTTVALEGSFHVFHRLERFVSAVALAEAAAHA